MSAIESDVVKVHAFSGKFVAGVPTDDMIKGLTVEYVDLIKDAVSNGSTYPLYDDWTGSYISAAIQEGEKAPLEFFKPVEDEEE